jgi:hypothetical protein
MKLLASLIIAVSLVIGVTGAMTAYLVPLTLTDDQLVGLHLNAPAGLQPVDPARPVDTTERTPLAQRGDVITPELLQALRDQNVVRVDVKEFVLRGWVHGWGMPLFLVGVVGLIAGAIRLRKANRALLMQSAAASVDGHAVRGMPTPEVPFRAIRDGIDRLRRDLPGLTPEAKLPAIMETFGEAQRTHIPAFVAMRPQLIARLGLGGYAQFMDSFAAAERQLNRAWSAAADGVLDEALERVELAGVLLDEAAAKLR